MTQQDSAVSVDLPEAETGILLQEEQTKKLTISIPAPGEHFYVASEPVEMENLRHMMLLWRRDKGESAEIRIRTSKDVSYGNIKPILRMAAECGIMHVTFAVTAKESAVL